MSKPTLEKLRLDQALVDRGYAPSRSQARDIVKRGCVRVDGVGVSKPAFEVVSTALIEVAEGAQPYVSRGGLKLEAALDAFGFDPAGVVALDIGASTGGFTDVLLRRGARCVYAVDVGSGQLHPRIASDARVIVLERHDARLLDASIVGERPGGIVADLSFISVTKALSPALELAAPGAFIIALVKPQFELGPADIGKGGIVRDPAARDRAVAEVTAWVGAQPGWRAVGVIASPISGGSGNVEMLLGARRDG